MKMIIQTEKDLQQLQGKFVLQVNNDEPDKTLMEFDWGFVKEKRLKLICGKAFADLYGYINDYETFEKFQKVFNEHGSGRFHRLLTAKELDYLLVKLKEENY